MNNELPLVLTVGKEGRVTEAEAHDVLAFIPIIAIAKKIGITPQEFAELSWEPSAIADANAYMREVNQYLKTKNKNS